MSGTQPNNQELYERIRKSSKDEVVLEEMISLGVASCCPEVQNDLPQRLLMGLEAGTYGREFLRDLDRRLLSLVGR